MYGDFIKKEVNKSYKKADLKEAEDVREEHAKLSANLGLEERIFRTVKRDAFITMKDHKVDFRARPAVRLLNPTKNELGRVAKKELAVIIRKVKELTQLNLCVSTKEVINWFSKLDDRKSLSFIVVDIVSFYPAITP